MKGFQSLLSLLVVVAGVALCSSTETPTEAGAPATIVLPKISWHQTDEDVQIKFNASGYNALYYNTSVRHDKGVLRLVLQSATSQQFLRLHLAGGVVAEATAAEVAEEQATLTLKKAAGSHFWDQAVLFATQDPVYASVDVMIKDAEQPQTVRAAEFEEVAEEVRSSLRAAGLEEPVADEDVATVASSLTRQLEAELPVCHQDHFCTCASPFVFNGLKCIDGASWVQRPSRIVSSSQLPSGDTGSARFMSAEHLMQLSDADLVRAFESFRSSPRPTATWPSEAYAQSLPGRQVLVAGAGLRHFEPLVMAQMGANVTFADPEPANLALMARLGDLARVPRTQLHMRAVASHEDLKELPQDFDVVLALDSLTSAPAEVMVLEYRVLLDRLRVGGRWIQTAPSKSKYRASGDPALNGNFQPLGETAPVPEWADWLDLPKLLELFPPAAFEVNLVHQNDNGFFVDLRLQRKRALEQFVQDSSLQEVAY